MARTFRLGTRLRYPITVVKLLKSRGDKVKKQESLMRYSFKWTREVGDHIRGETWDEEQVTVAEWDSPADGEITQWHIKEGDVLHRDAPCLAVEEACSHEIQFQGLCAICGKDMTEVNWATDRRDTDRAPINMTHDQTNLTVSAVQAERAEHELQGRLLKQRKLSLVVDLDQTIIHACIEPTIGEWQRDPQNPNYESVKEVKSFQLNDDGPRGLASGCWYYIKMRPGLETFLSTISKLYELHVYTMGTRAYALNIAKIVDPEQKLFGNRVISRDENGSMTAKSLQRLFPVSTNMVVIIDDRADVWPRNRPNLIKVTPYDFFKGIGDINSSFLPRREDLLSAASTPGPAISKSVGSQIAKANGASPETSDGEKVSALEELAGMSGGDDPILTKKQMEEQERTLEKQIVDRPLLHMQEKLDKLDQEGTDAVTPSESDSSDEQATSPVQRHHLLLDDDTELSHLEEHLTRLHTAYYKEYDRKTSAAIPDVGRVLDSIKAKVLQGTKIVLSGLVPMGIDVRRSEIGLQASSFGAQIRERVTNDITHLVISSSRPRTQKVRQAAKIQTIKIVNQDWLAESLTQWTWVDETPYLVDIHPADRPGGGGAAGTFASDETTDAEAASDADDSDDQANANRKIPRNKPLLQIISETGQTRSFDDMDESGNEDGTDEEGLLPSKVAEGQLSPVDGLKSFNWGEADEELDEFLNSVSDDEGDDDGDDDKEDNESSQDTNSPNGEGGQDDAHDENRKRKLNDGEDNDADTSDGDSVSTLSKLAKKQRMVRNRPSSNLRAEFVAERDLDSSLPTPQITGDEDEVSLLKEASQTTEHGGSGGNGNLELDFNEDDLEADLMAEFEAEETKARALELEREKG